MICLRTFRRGIRRMGDPINWMYFSCCDKQPNWEIMRLVQKNKILDMHQSKFFFNSTDLFIRIFYSPDIAFQVLPWIISASNQKKWAVVVALAEVKPFGKLCRE